MRCRKDRNISAKKKNLKDHFQIHVYLVKIQTDTDSQITIKKKSLIKSTKQL